MPSKVAAKRKKPSLVFVPSKPWDSVERRRFIAVPGSKGGRIQASLFEYLVLPDKKTGQFKTKKKGSANKKVLRELFESNHLPPALKGFVADLEFKKGVRLTEQEVRKQVRIITRCLDRSKLSPTLFSVLETLRVDLIAGLVKYGSR